MNTPDDTQRHYVTDEKAGDKRWHDSFRTAFAKHNPPPELTSEVLREIRRSTREAGESAEELFGPADEYAALVAEERISEERRSAVDLTGQTPEARLRNGVTLVLGYFAGSTFLQSWSGGPGDHEITVRSLFAATVIGGLAMVVFGLVPAMRSAGWLRASWWTLGGAVTAMAAAVCAALITDPPDPVLAVVPSLVVSGGFVALIVLIHLMPKGAMARWFEAREHHTDDEVWFRRLDSLLRGRHGVSLRTAKNHVAEAREHYATAGSSARNVFGPVEHYARALADSTPPEHRKARRTAVLHGFLGVCAAVFAMMAAFGSGSDYDLVVVCIFAPCALVLLGHSVVLLRQIQGRGR